MNKPEISILLPFKNAGDTLDRAIKSLLNQAFSNFELLLIDNNSTDRSSKIAEAYCKRDLRCRYIHVPTPGIVSALNRGLEISGGKYIARMDADDWSFEDRLEAQYVFLENHEDYGVVSGNAEYIPHKNDTDGFRRYVNWSNSIINHEDMYRNQFVESPIIHPTVMWRKEVSDNFGSYRNGDFPEDYELWLRWLSHGVKFTKINKPVIKWYDSDHRLTRTDDRYGDLAFYKIKAKYLAHWLKSHIARHPDVAIWGASKLSRKRASFLADHGININAYIDVSKKRQLDRNVIHYRNLPAPEEIFVLVYLKEASMRSKTVEFLNSRGFIEGKNYLLAS
ncbi:MAG: glycosyltransferase [Cytophagales bacterium]|nr:glycosyltransferase [Cytophagales bacterium]